MANLRGKVGSQNRFDNDELRKYYEEYERCKVSGKMADCFHHTISRNNKYTNSIINASPVNNQHVNIAMHGELQKKPMKVLLLYRNMKRLQSRGFVPKENDINFINEYPEAREALQLL